MRHYSFADDPALAICKGNLVKFYRSVEGRQNRRDAERIDLENEIMPTIETVATPVHNRISIQIPKEYASYSFKVVLVPFTMSESSLRTVKKVPGLSFEIKDEDLFSDDADMWEACSNETPIA
ncbi:MAG: hypothetical protein IKQ17_09605 [Kiritimatiellae bacterium]|nr:hypothetical protein [Kiritimatiellia bacterium]